MLADLVWRGWTKDLCAYYAVSDREARRLGQRRPGRRPSLPGSSTCSPVSGWTLEELWAAWPRDTEAGLRSFWREVGAWFSFRQVHRNRRRSFRFILRRHPARFLEWGAGVCPASVWLIQHGLQPAHITVVDVPCEHFTFGVWRLRQLLRRRSPCTVLRILEAAPNGTPTLSEFDYFDGAACLETLEHLPSPLRVIQEISAHLVTGAWLWEDFRVHGLGDEGAPWDLPQAQTERDRVYRHLLQDYELLKGEDWRAPDGGRTRGWRKRSW